MDRKRENLRGGSGSVCLLKGVFFLIFESLWFLKRVKKQIGTDCTHSVQ